MFFRIWGDSRDTEQTGTEDGASQWKRERRTAAPSIRFSLSRSFLVLKKLEPFSLYLPLVKPSLQATVVDLTRPSTVSLTAGNKSFLRQLHGSVPPNKTPWLPQCSTVNVGTGYTLLAQPAAVSPSASTTSSSSDVINTEMTGQEYVTSTGFDASKLAPMPLPVVDSGTVAGGASSVCSSNAAYSAGPTASRTTCYLVSCLATGCFTCSGTFVADPAGQGRLLFITATHCVAKSAATTISLANSFVTCNRNAGVSAQGGDGVFQPTAVAISRIDFNVGFGLTDGSLIQLRALSNTDLAYAKPVAVGAVTPVGLSQSVPNFSAGFPQVYDRLEGCTQADLGNVDAVHYSRVNTVRSLTSSGIQITGLSGCGGNSGGTIMDEQACVLFGVLSASAVSCGRGTSSNIYSRIVASATEVGVPFFSLAGGLVSGQVVFVN